MNPPDHPKVLPAICISVCALVTYAIVRLVSMLVLSFLFVALCRVPFLRSLLAALLYRQGGTPTEFVVILAVSGLLLALSGKQSW